jgi:PPOX class probable F420-dependent enzyme
MGVLPSTTLTEARSRERFVTGPCAILGTIDHVSGAPHQVPVTFVVLERDGADHLYVPLDHKPKTSTNLKRFRNIRANPAVSLLVNHYDPDWNHLWWAKADGAAVVTETDELPADLAEAFAAKYSQYVQLKPAGVVIDVTVARWSGWAFTEL